MSSQNPDDEVVFVVKEGAAPLRALIEFHVHIVT